MSQPFGSAVGVALRLVATILAVSAAATAQETKGERLLVFRNVGSTFPGAVGGATFDVIVRDGLLEAVSPSSADFKPPPGALVTDLTGRSLAPGIHDAYKIMADTPSEGAGEAPAPEAARPRGPRRRPDGEAPGGPEGITSIGDEMPRRGYDERGIRAETAALTALVFPAEGDLTALRSGIVSRLMVPTISLVSGHGALITTGPGGRSEAVVSPAAGLHAAFRGSRNGYPSTIMGMMAQFRQLFLDARRHAGWKRDYEAHPTGLPRPPYEPVLDAVDRVLCGKDTLAFWCRDGADARRALSLAREFGFVPVLAGEYGLAAAAKEIADAGATVALSLTVPTVVYPENRPLVALEGDSAESPRSTGEGDSSGARRTRRGRRDDRAAGAESAPAAEEARVQPESAPAVTVDSAPTTSGGAATDTRPTSVPTPAAPESGDGAIARWVAHEREVQIRLEREKILEVLTAPARLAAAGVVFAFAAGNGSDGEALLRGARLSTKHGLNPDVARHALSSVAVRGAGDAASPTLLAGRPADFLITTGDLLDPKCKIEGAVVNGHWFRFDADDRARAPTANTSAPSPVDRAIGTWSLEIRGFGRPGTATLVRTEAGFEGKLVNDDIEARIIDGTVNENTIRFAVTFTMGGATFDVRARGTLDGDDMRGTVEAPEMGTLEFIAKRLVKGNP